MNTRFWLIKFALIFTLPQMAAAMPAALSSELPKECEKELTRQNDNEELRRQFIDEFAGLKFTTAKENKAWIDEALLPQNLRRVHVLMANAWIKTLNDKVFKNKDLVTALTNFHKRLFLQEWNSRLKSLSIAHYSDFKTERESIATPEGDFAYKQIEAAFAAANRRFYESRRVREIVRAEDLNESWFAMGVAFSADESSLAEKFARKGGGRRLRYFWEPDVQAYYQSIFAKAKQLNAALLSSLKQTPLLEKNAYGWGLKLEIFAAARKAVSEEALQLSLIQHFPGVLITPSLSAMIREFCQLADEFTPPLMIEERESLMIHEAPFGAISLDFLGLGAENIQATAQAIAMAKDLDEGIRLTRRHERDVTSRFKANQDLIRNEVTNFFANEVSVRFSGDDGIIIPQREFTVSDQIQLLKKLANLFPRPFVRVASINADGARSDASRLIAQGEGIEKRLRALILEKSGLKLSQNLTMQALIFDSGRSRKVFLVVGMRRKLTAQEKMDLKSAFQVAVKALESEIQAHGSALIFEAADIFAIAR